jgi:hypothetical protein
MNTSKFSVLGITLLLLTHIGACAALNKAAPGINPKVVDISVAQIAGRSISPKIYFPAGSQVSYIGLAIHGNSRLQVTYVAMSPLDFDQTIAYYRIRYNGHYVVRSHMEGCSKFPDYFLAYKCDDTQVKYVTIGIHKWSYPGDGILSDVPNKSLKVRPVIAVILDVPSTSSYEMWLPS